MLASMTEIEHFSGICSTGAARSTKGQPHHAGPQSEIPAELPAARPHARIEGASMSRQESVPAPAAAKGVTTVRTACPLAWLLPGLYAALTVLGLVLQRLAGRPEDAVIGLAGDAALSAAILVSSLVGGLLAANRPANPIGWIMSATALVWALQQFCFGYAAYGLLAHPGSLPAAIPVGMLHVMMALLLELGIALLFLLFPAGRLPWPRCCCCSGSCCARWCRCCCACAAPAARRASSSTGSHTRPR